MDQGIWATWYDLEAGAEDRFLAWLHGEYLPFLKQIPGHAWVAHYRNVGPGAALANYHEVAGHSPTDIGTGSQYVILVGAPSTHTFIKPFVLDRPLPHGFGEMLAQRKGLRTAILCEEARIDGPAAHTRLPGSTPAPAIQFGSFRIRTVEEEFDLARWYAQYRFPTMAQLPGVVMTRKFLCSVGWAKHAVLYEFESLEARTTHFEEPHESLVMDPQEWTGRIVRTTLHTPGSPVVGDRLWPPVE